MEVNKDEAERCLDIARRKLAAHDFEGAAKLTAKSMRLYPTQAARDLEKEIEAAKKSSASSSSSSSTSSSTSSSSSSSSHHTRNRHHSQQQPSQASAAAAPKKKKTYKPEIQKILDCKTYYEVLEVEKDVSETDIKKAYRKLALQYHPDKNSEEGADEAFKVIGEAFGVLSDVDKRRRYDMVGPERTSSLRGESSAHHDPMRQAFASDFTPEELFDLFFNGRMPGNRGAGREGVQFRTYSFGGPRRTHRHHEAHAQTPGASNYSFLFQLLPFILLLIFSLLPSAPPPVYSMNKASPYTVERESAWNHVPYYVQPTFAANEGRDVRFVRKVELEVEENYRQKLSTKCYYEKQANRRRQTNTTPSCDKLNAFVPPS